MEVNLDELLLALRDLKFNIDEAKNLVFNGKIVQCDRKLQGCQVRCNNIFNYVATLRAEGTDGVVDDTNIQSPGKE